MYRQHPHPRLGAGVGLGGVFCDPGALCRGDSSAELSGRIINRVWANQLPHHCLGAVHYGHEGAWGVHCQATEGKEEQKGNIILQSRANEQMECVGNTLLIFFIFPSLCAFVCACMCA